ncbi:MAG: methyl-accepting chemotaxis protein [Spirochaetales bacterium]|nr:methyl-accepting chemotaxis protein [Spirochaetales bacterium]
MKLKDMKIGTKLIGSFIVLLGFMLSIGIAGLVYLRNVQLASDGINSITLAQFNLAKARQDSLRLIYTAIPLYAEKSRENLDAARDAVDEMQKNNEQAALLRSEEAEKAGMDLRGALDSYREALLVIEEANLELKTIKKTMTEAGREVDEPLVSLERFVISLTEEAYLNGQDSRGSLLLTQNLVQIYEMTSWWEKMEGVMIAYEENSTEDNLIRVNNHLDTMDFYFERADEVFTTARGREILSGAKEPFDVYRREARAYVIATEAKNSAINKAVLAGNNAAEYAGAAKNVLSYIVSEIMESAIRYTLISTIAALVISIVLAVVITKGITLAVIRSMKYAQDLAGGDFSVALDMDRKDEIGQLGTALEDMVDRVRKVLRHIQDSSRQVTGASGQISASAQSISVGTSEQASSMEEVSASLEELGSSIQQNAANADRSNSAARETAQGSREGVEAVRETVNAMREIGDKIGVIEDIARNTNMLALNAAIEAARAGEAGKGFAVVASEVRKLAESSGSAAKVIIEITSSNVVRAEKALEKIESIVPSMNLSAELSDEIALSSQEQSKGAEQINLAVSTLDQVVQQNASASEELASMSEELEAQARSMNEAVGFFRLGDGVSGEDRVEVKNLSDEEEPLLLADGTDGEFESFT